MKKVAVPRSWVPWPAPEDLQSAHQSFWWSQETSDFASLQLALFFFPRVFSTDRARTGKKKAEEIFSTNLTYSRDYSMNLFNQ